MSNLDGLDPTGTSIGKKRGADLLRTSTVDAAGDYKAPEDLSSYSTNKNFGGKKGPMSSRCSTAHSKRAAVAAPTLKGQDRPTPMCSSCWDKIKNDPSKIEIMPVLFNGDDSKKSVVRTQLAQAETMGRARDAAVIHKISGQEIVVQGPGRRPKEDEPVDISNEGTSSTRSLDEQATAFLKAHEPAAPTALETTLRKTEIIGGRNPQPGDDVHRAKALAAVQRSIAVDRPEEYHAEAEKEGLDRETATKFLPQAVLQHRRNTKAPATTRKRQSFSDITVDEPEYHDDTEDLMKSDIGSVSNSGKKSNNNRPD